MEVFGLIGMSLGSMGFIFGMMGVKAINQVAQLRKEHEALEKKLIEAGVLKDAPVPEQE